MRSSQTMLWGAVLGLTAVAFGAFGSHALRDVLAASGRTETFELAVRYQFYHALALLISGLFHRTLAPRPTRLWSAFFVAGVLLFSGSLYLLTLTNFRAMAWLTPVGGVALLTGWVFFIRDIIRLRTKPVNQEKG